MLLLLLLIIVDNDSDIDGTAETDAEACLYGTLQYSCLFDDLLLALYSVLLMRTP
jgi:hypothetical protein